MTQSFFDDRPPAVRPVIPKPPWDTEIGHGVDLVLLVARNRGKAIVASGFIAYSNGFEFDLILIRRTPLSPRADPVPSPPEIELFDGSERQLVPERAGGSGSAGHVIYPQRFRGLPETGRLRFVLKTPTWAAGELGVDAGPILRASQQRH